MKVLSGGRDEHVEGWRGGWKRTSLRRGRDEHVEGWRGGWKRTSFAEKWKGKGRSTSSGSSKKRNKYASFIVCINFLATFSALYSTLHFTLHSTLAPPSFPPHRKKQRKACTFTLPERQNALVHPMLCNGTAAFESCLKRLVPMHIEKYVQKRK